MGQNVLVKDVDFDQIYLDCGFADDAKVDGKLFNVELFKDTTSDSSGDKILKSAFFDKNKIRDLKESETFFSETLLNLLKESLKSKNIDVLKYDASSDGKICKLEVKILTYNEGEYNLIINVPTNVLVKVNFLKDGVYFFSVRKKYTVKANNNFPREVMRLEVISTEVESDIFKMINKIIK